MRAMLVAAVMLGGCATSDGTSESDAEVRACRSTAQAKCDELGFGTSTTCLLVFAKACSVDDEEAAREECVIEAGLPDDAPCCLKWR